MLSLVGLYQRAEHNGISVNDFPLKKRAALVVLDDSGGCHIAIDRRKRIPDLSPRFSATAYTSVK